MQEELEVDFSGERLAICLPCYTGQVSMQFMHSMIESVAVMKQMGLNVFILWEVGNALVQNARDRLVHKALQEGATKIMFIDCDIAFTDDDLMRILGFSTHYPVVCAAYPARKDPPTYIVSIDDIKHLEWNKHGLLKVESLGFGFICVDAEVFRTMQPLCEVYDDMKAKLTDVHEYFKVGVVDRRLIGEDICFFRRAKDLGYDVWLDASINLKHMGTKTYDGNFKQTLLSKSSEVLI